MSDEYSVTGYDVDAEVDVEEEDGKVVRMSIDVRNLEYVRLALWELQQLHADMRVGASPFADRLGRVIERFVQPGDEAAE